MSQLIRASPRISIEFGEIHMLFDKHRYLLHLVPVGNRYLLARQKGLFPKPPTLGRKPDFDSSDPHHFGALERTQAPLKLMEWLESLHASKTEHLFLQKASMNPFVQLFAKNKDGSGHLWEYAPYDSSLLVPQLKPLVEFPHDNLGQSVMDCEQSVRKALEKSIDFARKHPAELSGWLERVSHAKDTLDRQSSGFSDYLYLTESSIPSKVWKSLMKVPHKKSPVAISLFTVAELFPAILEATHREMADEPDYQALLIELEDVYLDCLTTAANSV